MADARRLGRLLVVLATAMGGPVVAPGAGPDQVGPSVAVADA
jgi:hypothetical protein